MSDRILLFVPMYNCAKQVPRVIAQLTPEVRELLAEILVIDNRSPDNGPQAATEALAKLGDFPSKLVINDGNYGLGGSQKVAFTYALENGFDYVIMLHGDDQGSIADIVPALRRGDHRDVDALLGARFMKGSTLPGYSAIRTLGNHVFNAIYSVATGMAIKDLGSGLNMYRVSSLADRWWLRNADDLTFNYHMIVRSAQAGWKMRFFPLNWREDDQVSNVKLVSQTLRVARLPLAYTFRRRAYLAHDYARRPGEPYPWTLFSRNGVIVDGGAAAA
ncbi:MAG: glycosyltransferase [Rhizorhabdus sp.]|nr:glycosyltransferase [Rhizorhabdus sp.]